MRGSRTAEGIPNSLSSLLRSRRYIHIYKGGWGTGVVLSWSASEVPPDEKQPCARSSQTDLRRRAARICQGRQVVIAVSCQKHRGKNRAHLQATSKALKDTKLHGPFTWALYWETPMYPLYTYNTQGPILQNPLRKARDHMRGPCNLPKSLADPYTLCNVPPGACANRH